MQLQERQQHFVDALHALHCDSSPVPRDLSDPDLECSQRCRLKPIGEKLRERVIEQQRIFTKHTDVWLEVTTGTDNNTVTMRMTITTTRIMMIMT